MKYSLDQFEKDIASNGPRPFDTYVLPAFMTVYAVKSKCMGVTARRILFIAGIYSGYRSYTAYKKLFGSIRQNIPLDIGQVNIIPEKANNL